MTTERPILFSAPMVRALLAGTKTQTRRVVKDTGLYAIDAAVHGPETAARELLALASRCPYGQPGHKLWVREAWRTDSDHDDKPPRDIHEGVHVWYEAGRGLSAIRGLSRMGKLRPGMFMPRWASRITLEVSEVRVERLQAISEADAIAEGIGRTASGHWLPGPCDHPEWAYHQLWDQINGAGAWDLNPFVWCVSFRRIDAS